MPENHAGWANRLGQDIAARGGEAPIIVADHPERAGRYVIIDGHRRVLAAATAGLTTVPVYHRDLTRQELALRMLAHGLHGNQWTPLELAQVAARLHREHSLSLNAITRQLRFDVSRLSRLVRVAEHPTLERLVAANQTQPGTGLPLTMAEEIVRVQDPQRQAKLAEALAAERAAGGQVTMEDVRDHIGRTNAVPLGGALSFAELRAGVQTPLAGLPSTLSGGTSLPPAPSAPGDDGGSRAAQVRTQALVAAWQQARDFRWQGHHLLERIGEQGGDYAVLSFLAELRDELAAHLQRNGWPD